LRLFFTERIAFYLRDVCGFPYDVVNAVVTSGTGHLPQVVARTESIASMRGSADFLAVSAAFKRMDNILRQADFPIENGRYNGGGDPVEEKLHIKFMSVDAEVAQAAGNRDFTSALKAIATLRPEVDAFFEGVMVNDPEPSTRDRRLGLLALIVRSFSPIADFSEIVTAG
jgi:glycyl-tRNA synthetase beta chain